MAVNEKPTGDDPGDWEQGCQAGLSQWESNQIQADNKQAASKKAQCQSFENMPTAMRKQLEQKYGEAAYEWESGMWTFCGN